MTLPFRSHKIFEPAELETVWRVHQRLLQHRNRWPAELDEDQIARLVLDYADAAGDEQELWRKCLGELDRLAHSRMEPAARGSVPVHRWDDEGTKTHA